MKLFNLPFLNWLFLMILAGLLLPSDSWQTIDIYSLPVIIGGIVILISLIWIFACVGYFIYFNTSPDPRKNTENLITTGPFKFSRNPMYLAFLLISLAIAAISCSAYFIIAGGLFFILTHYYTVPKEEKMLARCFSQQWSDYIQQTRRWL
ncbi:methyltransferase family protein [Moellerella wisconsensis]|uniref:Isoprenylcysteine carboxylmethyltransferase family protein n=1 Tax=Moellerella wisconsensis TaxID=158849 RepID=A0ACD3YBE9_9GAMM|nr:isoprenylcysteine carboxylmethyltransferase family protein [Moellerella wisconsensis]UNH40089.1 isoprenylcysteine carboxylmethyltransferase family protein [Moellerella wisconsensis]